MDVDLEKKYIQLGTCFCSVYSINACFSLRNDAKYHVENIPINQEMKNLGLKEQGVLCPRGRISYS